MSNFANNVRVPGVAWAVLIILAVAGIHENEVWIESTLGVDPVILDLVVAALIATMKSLSLGTEQLNRALDIIDTILSHRKAPPTEGMRSAHVAEDPVPVEEIPPRPNPVATWLWG